MHTLVGLVHLVTPPSLVQVTLSSSPFHLQGLCLSLLLQPHRFLSPSVLLQHLYNVSHPTNPVLHQYVLNASLC